MSGKSMVEELLNTINRYKNNKRYVADESTSTIDPTTGPEDGNVDKTITIRTLGITFETIYQNLAAYPSHIDMSNSNFIKRTFYLENEQKIYVNIDMSEEGTILTTITGDTSLENEGLVKEVQFTDIAVDTVYRTL